MCHNHDQESPSTSLWKHKLHLVVSDVLDPDHLQLVVNAHEADTNVGSGNMSQVTSDQTQIRIWP